MSIHKVFLTLILGSCGLSALMAQTTPTVVTRQASFAPVGVALTETMQVNLFNQASNSSNGTAASCTGSVSFVDASGKAISGAGGTFTVAAGVTQPISLMGNKANSSTTTGSRAEIRAVVTLNIIHGTPCSLVDTLELFDSTTGALHLFLNGGNSISVPLPFGFKD